MKYDTRALDAMFRCVSPSYLLDQLVSDRINIGKDDSMELFKRFAANQLSEYSLDEHNNICEYIWSQTSHMEKQVRQKNNYNSKPLASTALFYVLVLADNMLKQRGQEPLCRIEHVQAWRDAYLLLGQDLFVCAFLAREDVRDGWERNNFAWPATLRTDHAGLNELLDVGVCENHQHLYGSSQTFALSWCNLMNYPESHKNVDASFNQLFQPFQVTNPNERLLTTREHVRYACLLRKRLFCWLKDMRDMMGDEKSLVMDRHLSEELRTLRYTYGARVIQPNQKNACLDYALEDRVYQASKTSHYRALAGERHLIYECYRRFLTDSMDERIQLMFYSYIVLKLLVRSELIQVNGKRGFRNFSNYQDRKTMLCDRPCYWAELIRMGVNAPIREGRVCSLETRITPKATREGYIHAIEEIDRLFCHADRTINDNNESLFPLPKGRFESPDKVDFFYVIHFIKRPEEERNLPPLLEVKCRHDELRQQVRTQAIALYKAIHSDPYFRDRIRGIDSASHEIGCPPEVFAQAFRFLRNRVEPDVDERFMLNQTPSQLGLTYHAGEDFLDIAGALRAIDEAMEFLEMERGDRLGHVLGLGIEPDVHYRLKGRRIFIPKQDRLDDLIWLLYRTAALGVNIPTRMKGIFETEAWALFKEIYGEGTRKCKLNVGLQEYYYSMRLRADDPVLYKDPGNGKQQVVQDPYEFYSCSTRSPVLEQYRQSKDIAELYHLYHYGYPEKEKGKEICQIDLDSQYISLLREVQDALQAEIAQKGIVIECNPTSNVLIGTFLDYELHPIFRFNNTGLEWDVDRFKHCKQLQVCINTDDLGVFDTSQEFEYALLFHALKRKHLDDGTNQYAEADILSYLDNIRAMGKRATFRPSHISFNVNNKKGK